MIERTFAWLGRSRRLAKDFEATIASAASPTVGRPTDTMNIPDS